MQACNQHHHLIIRPEDVWFSILTQLSFYINGNAEELRSFFVPRQDQKELTVVDWATLKTADVGKLAIEMTGLIADNVNDPEPRTWLLPDFTTTTPTDIVVGAILMMGTLQGYFNYTMELLCGLPSMKILGERKDWEKISKRLDMLPKLDQETEAWAYLLQAVLKHFIRSFDEPENEEVLAFWNKIAHEVEGGSGPSYISGWLTAFMFWDHKGQCLYPMEWNAGLYGCELDGILYHRVDTSDIAEGWTSVPVKVDDNGTIVNSRMVAGSVGIHACSSGQPLAQWSDPSSKEMESSLDSVQPVSGWWMYKIRGEA